MSLALDSGRGRVQRGRAKVQRGRAKVQRGRAKVQCGRAKVQCGRVGLLKYIPPPYDVTNPISHLSLRRGE